MKENTKDELTEQEIKEFKKSIPPKWDSVQEEIERLIYEEPKCSFEHAWNCAIEKALECFNGYQKDQK